MKVHRHLRLVWPPPPKQYSRPGRSIAVMGPTGAGKTTLVAALAGGLENLIPRNGFYVIYNGMTRQDSLRELSAPRSHVSPMRSIDTFGRLP